MSRPPLNGAAKGGFPKWQKRLLMGCGLFALVTSVTITLREERIKDQRHSSIARDIERERWRRRELGLPEEAEGDDGFAESYLTALKKDGTDTTFDGPSSMKDSPNKSKSNSKPSVTHLIYQYEDRIKEHIR